MFLKSKFHTERIFVTGSSSYLFNYFTDLPQLHGGHDPTDPNWVHTVAIFAVYSGMNTGSRDAEFSVLWLKAYGVHAVTVPGPTSIEYFPVFTNPHKFDGVLPILWNYEDTKVYAVLGRSSSLAHVVPGDTIVRSKPVNGLDIGEISTYVAALENPWLPLAEMHWHNLHSFSVETNLQPGQVISIQETYADGWHARVNGKPKPVSQDELGLMVLRPDCIGPCHVEMDYDGGVELWGCVVASALALSSVLASLSLNWKRSLSRQDTATKEEGV
jgi:hypothetical protein